MKVKTDYDGCDYITSGKEYECFESPQWGWPSIKDDDSYTIAIPEDGRNCAHLNGAGSWRFIEDSTND